MSNWHKNCETIGMNIQPVVDGGLQVPCNSYPVIEPVKPLVDEQPKEENFPVNDSILVGNGGLASASSSPLAPSSVSDPIIDLTVADLAEASFSSTPLTSVAASSEEISDKDAVKQTLLKELVVMGFKQVDLDKILRKNENNLEKSSNDLCGVAERDPMLQLQEMVAYVLQNCDELM